MYTLNEDGDRRGDVDYKPLKPTEMTGFEGVRQRHGAYVSGRSVKDAI